MRHLSRFHVDSPAFIRHAPSSLGVGEAAFPPYTLIVRIGTHEYAVDACAGNVQTQVEDIAEFHLRRYPQKPLWKTPARRPKK